MRYGRYSTLTCQTKKKEACKYITVKGWVFIIGFNPYKDNIKEEEADVATVHIAQTQST